MPWCPQCERFLSPPSVKPDGSCPACSTAVDPGRAGGAPRAEDDTEAAVEEESPPVPWHLKALAGAVALYLGWRAFEGIAWLVARF